MGRQYIHLATGLPGDSEVISGMRKQSSIFIYINLEQSLEGESKFLFTTNCLTILWMVSNSSSH